MFEYFYVKMNWILNLSIKFLWEKSEFMDIDALSIAMSQSRVQQSVGISLAKIAMDTGKESASQMTEMLKSSAVDPNLGQNLDIRA